jgi:rubrerythrin
MAPHLEILSVLQKAYQIETDGYTFYSMIADRTDKDAVRDVFGKLARDEVQHKAFLKDIASKYEEKGAAAFAVPRGDIATRTFVDQVLTARFKQQAKDATFEVSALSIGLTLETNAMALFNRQAEESTEREIRDFYRFLAEWERQHYEALQELFQDVRRELFSERGFDPF